MPHRKKHTMRWLRSILAVVLSCLLLCSLLCLYVLHVLERTVVETNTALTAYVQKSVDTRLEELHRYSTTIEITHANTLLKTCGAARHPARAGVPAFRHAAGFSRHEQARPGRIPLLPAHGACGGQYGLLRGRLLLRPAGRAAARGLGLWLAELTKSHDTRFMLLQMPKDERLCYVREMRMTGEIAAVVVDRDRPGGSRCAPRRGRPARRSPQGCCWTGSWWPPQAIWRCWRTRPGFMRPGARTRRPAPKAAAALRFSMPPPYPAGLCERVFRARPAAHGALYAGRLCGGRGVLPGRGRGGQRVHQPPQREAYGKVAGRAGAWLRRAGRIPVHHQQDRTDDDGKIQERRADAGAPDAAERPVPEHRPARRPAQRKRDLRRGQALRGELRASHLSGAGAGRHRAQRPGRRAGARPAARHAGRAGARGAGIRLRRPLRGAAERGGMPARQLCRGPCPRAAGPGLSRPARPRGRRPLLRQHDGHPDQLQLRAAGAALRGALGPPPGEPLYAPPYPRGLRRPA